MTITDIIKWKNDMVELAKTNLKRDGFLQPVTLMLIEKDGEIGMGIYEMDMSSTQSKNWDIFQIHTITTTNKVLALVMMSETWMRKPSDEEIQTGNILTPSECDDKDEALMITMETNDVSKIELFKIIRDDSNVIKDFDPLPQDKDDKFVGRFTNMLAKLN